MSRVSVLAGLAASALAAIASAVSAAAPSASSAAPAAGRQAHPNILFLLIDDMGYSDFSCFGPARVPTPNVDRVAKEGIRFTQFYVSAPICSPSRIGFTTGQYPGRWGITSYLDSRAIDARRGLADWLDPKAPVLARILHDAGYYTAHVGKWHMGGQRDIGEAPHINAYGFDSTLTSFEGLGERILPVWDPPPGQKEFHHTPTDMNAKLGQGPITFVPRYRQTQIFVDRAIEEMKKARAQHKPFYLNLWPDDVHSPCQAPPELRGDGSPEANYLGVMTEMDKQLGRVFDFVRSDAELRDNTVIVIASDNGPEKGLGYSDNLRGSKGQLYEGGIRLPLIVWAPSLVSSPGSTNSTTVLAGMDLPPSVLSIAHVAVPEALHFDGLDMSSALLGSSQPTREQPIFWVRPPDRPGPPRHRLPDLAVRSGQWKLLIHRNGAETELFDVKADPGEQSNVAGDHPDLVEKLSTQLLAWDKATQHYPHPATNPDALPQPKAGTGGE